MLVKPQRSCFTKELAALREAIAKTRAPEQANVYATMAKKASLPTSPIQDVAIVFRKAADLRSTDQCKAFITAILATLRLGSPLSWDEVGRVVTAMLLQPISAGEPTRQLVQGYEELLRQQPDAQA